MKPTLTPRLKKLPEKLINTLRQNKRAIKSRELATILGISGRELRIVFSYTRTEITPRIISGDYGYKFEEDKDKILDGLKRIQSHAISELKVTNKQKKLLAEESWNIQ